MRAAPLAVILALPALLAGCVERQSALDPAGADAARISTLAIFLFAGAAAVTVLVLAALWLALRGAPSVRRVLASERMVVIAGIAFPVVTLAILLATGLWMMRVSLAPASEAEPVLRVIVDGRQWWWRVTYLGADVIGANELRIPVGRPVELTLRTDDVIHSFWVPSLAGKVDMIPGRENRLRLDAQRPGAYRGQCAEYCGGPHALMAFEVVAMPEAEFAAWLAAARGPAPEPEGEEARAGRAVFLAAGCGSCHTVRGTTAAGTIGPDLTRLGERRFIGAATLPNTPQNLARFVRDSDHVKPGIAMPPFRIFTAEELAALAAYLASLR